MSTGPISALPCLHRDPIPWWFVKAFDKDLRHVKLKGEDEDVEHFALVVHERACKAIENRSTHRSWAEFYADRLFQIRVEQKRREALRA